MVMESEESRVTGYWRGNGRYHGKEHRLKATESQKNHNLHLSCVFYIGTLLSLREDIKE